MIPEWAKFEQDVQQMLGLQSTIGSGNKFYDPSDGVSPGVPYDDPIPLMVDCKTTENKSYRVDRDFLRQWYKKSLGLGYEFALPLRFLDKQSGDEDWVVIPLKTFVSLMDFFRKGHIIDSDVEETPKEVLDSLKSLEASIVTQQSTVKDMLRDFDVINGWVTHDRS